MACWKSIQYAASEIDTHEHTTCQLCTHLESEWMRACHVTRRVTGITVFIVPKCRLPCYQRLTRYFRPSECTRYTRKHVQEFPHTFTWFRYNETRLNRLELLGGAERSRPWELLLLLLLLFLFLFFFFFFFPTPPSSIQWLGYGSDDTGFESHLGKDIFIFLKASRHPPGPTPASYTMDTRVISHGKSGRSVKLTTHLRPGPRLRMSGAIPLLPYTPSSWSAQGRFTFTLVTLSLLRVAGFFFNRRNCASFYVFFRTHFRFVTGLHSSIQYLVIIYILQSLVFTQVRRLRNTQHKFQAKTRNW
jgi:hypothetical protein